MGISVEVSLKKSFTVKCSQKKAFDQLVDVASTTAMFPKLDKIVDLGGDVWRWEMAKIGVGPVSHQVKYTVKYTNNGESTIDWNPAPGDGNAQVQGGWVISADGDNACKIEFSSSGAFEMPAPGLLKNKIKAIAGPLVESEFTEQVDTFIGRIKAKLEG